MRLENISWLEKEQDERSTLYTYTLVEAPHYKVVRQVGYLLRGYYNLLNNGERVKTFKTEQELIDYLQKTLRI